jgi:hypothetical protein
MPYSACQAGPSVSWLALVMFLLSCAAPGSLLPGSDTAVSAASLNAMACQKVP